MVLKHGLLEVLHPARISGLRVALDKRFGNWVAERGDAPEVSECLRERADRMPRFLCVYAACNGRRNGGEGFHGRVGRGWYSRLGRLALGEASHRPHFLRTSGERRQST